MLQGLFSGLSGLISHRRALDVTAHNIANVNTEGYTKQRANFSSNPIKDERNIQMGTGSHIQSVTRMHDEINFSKLKSSMEDNSKWKEEFKQISMLNDILKETELGEDGMMELTDKLFKEIQTYSDNPNDESIKTSIKNIHNTLNDRAKELNNLLESEQGAIKQEKGILRIEADTYLVEIEDLSKEIDNIESLNPYMTDKEYANDLRDRRDLLESKLSKLGNFEVNKDSKGMSMKHNIADYGNVYEFNFNENSGRLAGLNNAQAKYASLQKEFNKAFDNVNNKVQSFIDNDFENPNEIIQWYYDKSPNKNIQEFYIGLSSYTDFLENMTGSTELILKGYQEQHDKLSKVNIDEEMVNQIKYQRAYEANAKVVQTMDEILQTTLDLKR